MAFYRVTPGQSPAMVARALGTSVSALMSANSHKPTTVVAGRRTFQSLRYNELLHRPRVGVGALGEDGMLGAVTPAAPGAPHAMIAVGSSGPDVALWQKIIGVTADGSFGNGTAAATKSWQSSHGLPADGVVGPNTWAKALGNATSAPVAVTAPAGGPSLAIAAGAAYTALNQDPNYCTSVAKSGTAVNTAVHNFKAAWNAANPNHAVPIGTGKYEPVVAAALSSALAGVTVPAGCGGPAVAPPPVPPGGAPPPPPPIVTPVSPSPASTDLGGYNATQIATATAMNSALAAHGYKQADQGIYMAFQRAMGLTADGYPGTGTMGQLSKVLAASGIPMAQVPIYPWHAGAWDGKNAPTAASWSGASAPSAAPAPAAPAAPAAAAAAAAADAASTPAQADQAAAAAQAAIDAANRAAAAATTQKQADDAAAAAKVAQTALDTAAAKGGTAPGTGIVTKKLSTGAIVAGAVGAAAVVGLLAMALTGKKKTGRRGPSGKRGKRGPAKRKSSKHKRKARR